MKTRVISSVVIGILLLIVLKSGGYVLAAVLCLVSMAAYVELMRALGAKRLTKAFLAIGFTGIALHYILLVTDMIGGYAFAAGPLFVLIASVFFYVGRYPEIPVRLIPETLFAFAYSTILLSFLLLLRALPHGSALVWVPFDAWMCDMGAYLSGRWFGKHKLSPTLSPKKTVEGALGGALVAALTGTVFGCLMVFWGAYGRESILPLTFAGLVIGILAQFGDLFASGIKRDTGIKDYGKLIPGHGGIMDRFDSVIFVTPVVYVMLYFLVV